jgi:nucleotide-binding universal stress UspA family protein
MDYKTILVHIDDTPGSAARTALAAELARTYEAHLIGVTQTGISRFIYQTALPEVDLSGLTPLFEEFQSAADKRARDFDTVAQQAGVSSFEHRVGDDEPGYALAMQAMYADLVIVGHAEASHDMAGAASMPEFVAMHSPCPVMVLPSTASNAPAFERILLAWNASPEAARAVRMALPFLKRASEVTVAIVDRNGHERAIKGGNELPAFLTRHGVAVEIQQLHGDEVADTLLGLAREWQAHLMVMGCYGHSRFREILLGGVSRAILRRLDIPALLAH